MARCSLGLMFALLLAGPCALSGEAPPTAILGAMGSEVNLLGREFLLDGVPIDALTPGVPFEIIDRGLRQVVGDAA